MTEPTLRASTVVAIILRLTAIDWAVIALIPGIGAISHAAGFPGSLRWFQMALHFFTPVAYGIAAMVSWIFAEGLAAKVTAPADPAVPLVPLTRGDWYGFGLLLGGLWFSSITSGDRSTGSTTSPSAGQAPT